MELTISTCAVFVAKGGPALIGPVLLAWLNEQLGEDGSVTFSGGGWGDNEGRLVDVSCSL